MPTFDLSSLLAPYGDKDRVLYRTVAGARRAIVAQVLCDTNGAIFASTVKAFLDGALSSDSPEYSTVEIAVDTAADVLLAAKRGEPANTFHRDTLATASTAARAAIRAYRKHGDQGLAAHDRNAAILRNAGMAYAQKEREARTEDPFSA